MRAQSSTHRANKREIRDAVNRFMAAYPLRRVALDLVLAKLTQHGEKPEELREHAKRQVLEALRREARNAPPPPPRPLPPLLRSPNSDAQSSSKSARFSDVPEVRSGTSTESISPSREGSPRADSISSPPVPARARSPPTLPSPPREGSPRAESIFSPPFPARARSTPKLPSPPREGSPRAESIFSSPFPAQARSPWKRPRRAEASPAFPAQAHSQLPRRPQADPSPESISSPPFPAQAHSPSKLPRRAEARPPLHAQPLAVDSDVDTESESDGEAFVPVRAFLQK